jgi:hypothetical protein
MLAECSFSQIGAAIAKRSAPNSSALSVTSRAVSHSGQLM